MTVFRIIPYASSEYEDAVRLREEILRKPLGLTFSQEERVAEKDHIHIAGFLEGCLVSTAVLVPEGNHYKLQRVVVVKSVQNSGIGSQMMNFCESYAKSKGISSLYCHARDTAVNFYLKNNYVPEGSYFDEVTLPHLKMRRILLDDK